MLWRNINQAIQYVLCFMKRKYGHMDIMRGQKTSPSYFVYIESKGNFNLLSLSKHFGENPTKIPTILVKIQSTSLKFQPFFSNQNFWGSICFSATRSGDNIDPEARSWFWRRGKRRRQRMPWVKWSSWKNVTKWSFTMKKLVVYDVCF